MKKANYLPQYIRIFHSVRNDIIDGHFPPGGKLPSIRSFSKQWSVSNITIVKAFEKLKEESLVRTSERSGFYVADRIKRNVSAKKVGFLSPILPQNLHKHKEIHAACSSLQESLRADGHFLSVHLARWYKDGIHGYLTAQDIADYGLDAVVLIHIYDYHYLSSLTSLGIPIILLDADASHMGVDSVFFDNTKAAMQLCNRLIQQGSSNILFVGGPKPHVLGQRKKIYYDPAATQREDGCHLAATMYEGEKDITIHCAYSGKSRSGDEWVEAANEYLEEHPEVDAILPESALRLHPKFAHLKMATFSASRNAPRVGNVVAYAKCDYRELVEQAAVALRQRFEKPYVPAMRIAVAPEILSP